MRVVLFIIVSFFLFVISETRSYACSPWVSVEFATQYGMKKPALKIDPLIVSKATLTKPCGLTTLVLEISLPKNSKMDLSKGGVYFITTENGNYLPRYPVKLYFDADENKYKLSILTSFDPFRVEFKLVVVLPNREIGPANKTYIIISDGEKAKLIEK